MNCQTCTNPTKYPIGFWDGKDSHGQIFDCQNLDCEIKKERVKAAKFFEEEKRETEQVNLANGVSIEEIKTKRKELGIPIQRMAKELGIFPSEYSCYEQCREPLPVEMVDKIGEVFNKRICKKCETFECMRWGASECRSLLEERIKEMYP